MQRAAPRRVPRDAGAAARRRARRLRTRLQRSRHGGDSSARSRLSFRSTCASRVARRRPMRSRRHCSSWSTPAVARTWRRVADMVDTSSTRRLKTVATLASIISLTLNFGLIDFVDGFTGFVDQARNQVLDVGWGAVFGVIVPAGLLTQLRRPERRIAGVQQTALVAVALAVAGAAGEAWWYLALAGGVGGVAAAAARAASGTAAHSFGAAPASQPALLVAAAAAAPPCAVYAWRMASAQRRHLPPADAVSNGLHHWTVMAALALLVVALVGARRTRDFRVAHSRGQRIDRRGRLGNLLSPRARRCGGKRRPHVGGARARVGGCAARGRRACRLSLGAETGAAHRACAGRASSAARRGRRRAGVRGGARPPAARASRSTRGSRRTASRRRSPGRASR